LTAFANSLSAFPARMSRRQGTYRTAFGTNHSISLAVSGAPHRNTQLWL
jgi:hypothetical protein